MKYRPLGTTGLFVSELCLGTMTFGGKDYWAVVGTQGEAEADEMVGAALDAGINFVDTADIYSFGESEQLLGKALSGGRGEGAAWGGRPGGAPGSAPAPTTSGYRAATSWRRSRPACGDCAATGSTS